MGSFLKKLFSFGWLLGSLNKTATLVDRIAKEALPIVQQIAALTPTRSDDEILRLFDKYGVANAQKWLALPQDKRGAALLEVATVELSKRFPTQTHIIQLAIQLALTQWKGGGV